MSNIIILPASRAKAVEGNYKVTVQQKWDGREGIGYNAILKRGRSIIADLHQDGNGGSTYVFYYSIEEEDKFKEYVAEWDFQYGEDIAEEYGLDFLLDHDEESVIDTLVEEALTLKQMNSSRKTFIIKAEEPNQYYVYNVPVPKGIRTPPNYLQRILKKGDKFWNKNEWVEV